MAPVTHAEGVPPCFAVQLSDCILQVGTILLGAPRRYERMRQGRQLAGVPPEELAKGGRRPEQADEAACSTLLREERIGLGRSSVTKFQEKTECFVGICCKRERAEQRRRAIPTE